MRTNIHSLRFHIWVFSMLFLFGMLNLPSICGQQIANTPAIYRDTVPLLIDTKLFVKKSPKGIYVFLSDSIKVSRMRTLVTMDTMMTNVYIGPVKRHDKNLDHLHLNKLQYAISENNHFVTRWQSIGNNKVLLDTVLRPGPKLRISFRQTGDKKIIQQTTITRNSLLPLVSGYRMKNIADTAGNWLTGKSIFEDTDPVFGFSIVRDSMITATAGKDLQLAIKSRGLNLDSSIEYRISGRSEGSIFSSWKNTGHLLTIDKLKSGKQYLLELQYNDGQHRINRYHITVSLFWWEEVWVKIGFIILIMLLTGLFIYAWNRIRRKRKDREIEKGIDKCIKEQSKLDTHLVDNIFHGALGLIRSNQNDLAQEYLGNASVFLREKLIHAEKILIPFEEDIKSLDRFIANERIKSGFRLSLLIDPSIQTGEILLPPLLWQPSLENAVKHGIKGTDGFIEVNIGKIGPDLHFIIKDNGRFKGNVNGKGFGIPITKERIIGLNMAYGEQKIEYRVERIENETVVNFIFREWLK